MESYKAAHVIEYGHRMADGGQGTRRQCFTNPFQVESGRDQLTKDSPIEELKAVKPGKMVFRDRYNHFAQMLPGGAIQIVGHDF